MQKSKNILSFTSEEMLGFFMKSERFHGFELLIGCIVLKKRNEHIAGKSEYNRITKPDIL